MLLDIAKDWHCRSFLRLLPALVGISFLAAEAPGESHIAYGDDSSQFGVLRLPDGTPRGVVVVLHGGFWSDQYSLELNEPVAIDLTQRGWATWNVEYRRVGNGGGDPQTFDDIHAAINQLADFGLDLSTVVGLGHSAGGHLITWAASRRRFGRWADGVDLTHVISQAGVLDLRAADRDGLGDGAVEAFIGHAPNECDDPLDPIRQVPLDVPVWCVHDTSDTPVPISQSQSYVSAATAAGADTELVTVSGDHFTLIDTSSDAWSRQLEILDSIA